jgi:hypothetical protein
MHSYPEERFDGETRRLLQEEARWEADVRAAEEAASGLRDIDAMLSLAVARMTLCLHLMERGGRHGEQESAHAMISDKALSALRLVETLVAENVSLDQKGIIQANPLFVRARALVEQFIVAGGGGFLEPRETDARRTRLLSRSVVAAVRKYMGEDDLYPPLALERMPGFVRRLLLQLFPVMVREHPEQPPYGIQEGEEVTYASRAMKLPLSQAIFYLENELLPELEEKLAASPGTASIQQEITRVQARVEEYRKLRFFPRSTPVLLEKGFHTEGMTSFSADGEMLVPIPIPVSFRSGTNLDRKMELVRMDVVRRVAGRGLSRDVDREYRRLRSLESGPRGSSRAASMKLDTVWGYGVLKRQFPFLLRLGDKERFKELVRLVQSSGAGAGEKLIESMINADRESPLRAVSLPG